MCKEVEVVEEDSSKDVLSKEELWNYLKFWIWDTVPEEATAFGYVQPWKQMILRLERVTPIIPDLSTIIEIYDTNEKFGCVYGFRLTHYGTLVDEFENRHSPHYTWDILMIDIEKLKKMSKEDYEELIEKAKRAFSKRPFGQIVKPEKEHSPTMQNLLEDHSTKIGNLALAPR